jgi:hypothetical protein
MKFFGDANLNVMDHVSGKVLVRFDENGEAEVKDEALIEKMKIYFRFEETAYTEAEKEKKQENVEANIPLENNKIEEFKTYNENNAANDHEDIKEDTNTEQDLKPKKNRKKEVKDSEV